MTTISEGFTFVDTTTSAKSIVLPYTLGLGPKLFFIKDSGTVASLNNITIAGRKDANGNTVSCRVAQWSLSMGYSWVMYDTSGAIETSIPNIIPISPITQNSRCIILYTNSVDDDYYCVGDHLPEVDFTYFSPDAGGFYSTVWKQAIANTINFCGFDADKNAFVKLPVPQRGAICIIILTSTVATADVNLYIRNNSQEQDYINRTYQGVLLSSDAVTLNPSITFISDGTHWYSIGTTGKNIDLKVSASSVSFYGPWTKITENISYNNILYAEYYTTKRYRYMPYIPASIQCGGITIHVNDMTTHDKMLAPDVSSQLIIPKNSAPGYNQRFLNPKYCHSVIWYATVSDINVATKYYPIILMNGSGNGYL
jgi:hypothetical protein